MSSVNPSSFTSLLSALFVVVALMFAGCTADSLTGPILGPETTVQGDGERNVTGDGEHNAVGDGEHNKDSEHNKCGDGEHNNC